jgi:hypothetical protein
MCCCWIQPTLTPLINPPYRCIVCFASQISWNKVKCWNTKFQTVNILSNVTVQWELEIQTSDSFCRSANLTSVFRGIFSVSAPPHNIAGPHVGNIVANNGQRCSSVDTKFMKICKYHKYVFWRRMEQKCRN